MPTGVDSKWGRWVTAPALDQLLSEINHVWPKRDKGSDGSIADHKHSPTSAHVPLDSDGDIVRARDFDKDGINVQTVLSRCMNDPYKRVRLIIWNRRSWNRDRGTWVRYTGTNPHTGHCHVETYTGTRARDKRGFGLWTPDKPSPPGGVAPGLRILYLTRPQLRGADVTFVQRFIGPAKCGAADGIYGPATERGVRWYQKMRGIGVDGIVGPATWRNMGVTR